MIIPEFWFSPGGLDCNGYNESINKNKKRRVFYSPFGDNVEANFNVPVQQKFQEDMNACYIVRFLKAWPTKESCIEYVQNRRANHPVVYNDRRLLENIPEMEAIEHENSDHSIEIADGSIDVDAGVDANADEMPNNSDSNANENGSNDISGLVNETIEANVVAELSNIVPDTSANTVVVSQSTDALAGTSAVFNIGSNHENPSTAAIVEVAEIKTEDKSALLQIRESNLDGNAPFIDLTIEPEEEEEAAIVVAQVPVEIGVPGISAAFNIGTNSHGNPPMTASVEVAEIKTEDKSALLQIRESNLDGEVPFIDLSNDPEEEAAIIAIENNAELDESDDEILPYPGAMMPIAVKYDFDSMDILSGDMPFKINVIASNAL